MVLRHFLVDDEWCPFEREERRLWLLLRPMFYCLRTSVVSLHGPMSVFVCKKKQYLQIRNLTLEQLIRLFSKRALRKFLRVFLLAKRAL